MNVMLDHITHNGNKVSYEKLWKTFLPTRTHTESKMGGEVRRERQLLLKETLSLKAVTRATES